MLDQVTAAAGRAPSESGAPSCAVLVCSCDAYRDLWPPFFHLFQRYWPDCPFPVYLGAGRESFAGANVATLHSPDPNWTASFRFFLDTIATEYVLVLLEDFFLDRPVQSALIQSRLETLHRMDGSMLRLMPKPGPDEPLASARGIGCIAADAPYRVSLQAAIWRRRDLLGLLVDHESAWDFEWSGTERSRSLPSAFLATKRREISYCNVVERGQWFWSAARRYRREPIACDFSARPVMGPLMAARKALNRIRKTAVDSVLPPGLRRRR